MGMGDGQAQRRAVSRRRSPARPSSLCAFTSILSRRWAFSCAASAAASGTLLEDLKQRGMLDKTLVVWMGEFGRTPKINPNAGRDHFPRVFNVALAGGGIKGGQVFGASDKIGGQPKEGRVRPEDLSATIFHCLGHRPEAEYQDRLGRPHFISRGEVLRTIL